jgi:hypothetical protein
VPAGLIARYARQMIRGRLGAFAERNFRVVRAIRKPEPVAASAAA